LEASNQLCSEFECSIGYDDVILFVYTTNNAPKSIFGYSSYDEKMPKPRDCIDIAVKIGFELEELQLDKKTRGEKEFSIYEAVCHQISNNKKTSPVVGHFLDCTFIRELQSTRKDIRRATQAYLKEQKDNIALLARVHELTYNNTGFEHLKLFISLLKEYTKQDQQSKKEKQEQQTKKKKKWINIS